MWLLNIKVGVGLGEEIFLTETDNTYWLQELVAKLLECENTQQIRLEKGVNK